jgi:hypothetical protein
VGDIAILIGAPGARCGRPLRTSSSARFAGAMAGAMDRLTVPLDAVTARLFELEAEWLQARVLDVLDLDRARSTVHGRCPGSSFPARAGRPASSKCASTA